MQPKKLLYLAINNYFEVLLWKVNLNLDLLNEVNFTLIKLKKTLVLIETF